MTETTLDKFLGGALEIEQPRDGYRAGIEPVMLAAATDAKPADRVLELGTGVGTALLCLGRRVSGLDLTGVEVQRPLAELARLNFKRNEIVARIHECDLTALPEGLRAISFDHVILNPPYFDRRAGSAASAETREAGRGENTPLVTWIGVSARRLRPKGKLTVILRASRLQDLLTALADDFGNIAILPIAGRHGREAGTVLVSAQKGSRGTLRLLHPFVLHQGDKHDGDRDSYTASAQAILKSGAPLPFRI